jgi:hypothetical protein
MLIAERKNLVPVAVLVSNESIHMEVLENHAGNIFVSCQAIRPQGTVYFAITPSMFCLFLEDLVAIQTLLRQSPSNFVEISCPIKSALYSTRDLEIQLKHGDKSICKLRQITQPHTSANIY